jgi:Dyp-type peroxidase family
MALQHLDTGDNSNIELADIQGDILVGLQKDAEVFIFFSIGNDITAFKRKLTALRPLVTSTKTVLDRERQIDDARKAGNRQRLPLFGLNLGFTYRGLGKLLNNAAFDHAHPLDPSFKVDAAGKADVLKDDTSKWQQPFTDQSIDGCLLVTGPKLAGTRAHADAILDELGDTITVVFDEHGQTRPQRGHEHFGFLDGVSQPGIRGLTKRQNPLDKEQGLPGQDLIHPGEFVFGYPGQMDPVANSGITKETIGDIGPPPLPWMRNGSYMVFRRLEQKVLLFRDFVETEGQNLGLDSGMLAARMVGRWPSGAPLMLAPLQDDPALGADTMANNGFEFEADPFQRRCPYAAHIRKTYPRDDLNDSGPPDLAGEGGEASVQTRRLRRAGIPFGPEIADDEEIGQEQSRGLMFVCYQTSIVKQFEFVQTSWVNSPNFVFGKVRPGPVGGPPGDPVTPGHDPIIGQTGGVPRDMDEPIPNYPVGDTRSSLSLPDEFVASTGAAYFFMPSLSALLSGPLVK